MATISLEWTISTEQLARAVPALKDKFGMADDATNAEVVAELKSTVARQIKGIVKDYEDRLAAEQAKGNVGEIDLT